MNQYYNVNSKSQILASLKNLQNAFDNERACDEAIKSKLNELDEKKKNLNAHGLIRPEANHFEDVSETINFRKKYW